jgi:hypothetical protein
MKKRLLGLGLSFALMAGACGGEDKELPEVDCSTPAVPTFAMVEALMVCANCHSTQLTTGVLRNGAPPGIDYDTQAEAEDSAEDGVVEVFKGDMPPKSSGFTLDEAQKTAFYRWALCGTP